MRMSQVGRKMQETHHGEENGLEVTLREEVQDLRKVVDSLW